MNPLNNSPKLRKIFYKIQWVVNGIAAVTAFVLVANHLNPAWFASTTGALNVLWTYLGMTADSNVDTTGGVAVLDGPDIGGIPLPLSTEPSLPDSPVVPDAPVVAESSVPPVDTTTTTTAAEAAAADPSLLAQAAPVAVDPTTVVAVDSSVGVPPTA